MQKKTELSVSIRCRHFSPYFTTRVLGKTIVYRNRNVVIYLEEMDHWIPVHTVGEVYIHPH